MEASKKACSGRSAAGARALLAGAVLALAFVALPTAALAQQTQPGASAGKLTISLEGSSGEGSSQGGSGGSGALAQTGDAGVAAVALAAAAAFALAAVGSLAVARSRAAEGARADASQPADNALPLAAAAIALALAALLLFGISARSAIADDDPSAQRATVSATMTVKEDGTVVSSEATFANQSSSNLTITGVSVPELGDGATSALVGRVVAPGAEAKASLNAATVPSSVVDAAKAAGGSVELEMTAAYTYESYTVAFDSNGGSDVDAQQVAEGECATEPSAPSLDGHIFKGWYADEDLASEFDFSAPVTADTTAYAKWAESVTVSFDANCEDVENPEPVTVEKGAELGKLPVPERSGYALEGWYDGDTKATASSAFDADVTLTAKWEAGVNQVIFYLDGEVYGTGTVAQGKAVTKPATPQREGRTFVGWFADADATVDFSFAEPVEAEGTVCVYGTSVEKTCIVSFQTDGGSAVESQTLSYGELATRPDSNPTKEGYTFAGWYADEDCTVEFNFGAPVKDDVEVYAKWQINTYTVSFDVAGGDPAPEAQQVTHGSVAAKPTATPSKKGYTFAGWYEDAALTKAYEFARAVTSDVVLHAKWNNGPTTYKVELYEQDEVGDGYHAEPTITGTVEGVTGEKTAYEAPVYEGYTSKAFDQQTIAADGSTTLKVYYDRNVYDVRFYASEDDKAAEKTYATMQLRYDAHATKPTDPTSEGYDFTGWYLKYADGTKRFIDWDADTMGAYPSGLDLYASWTPTAGGSVYTVKSEFEQPDGSYVADDSLAYTLHGTAGEQTSAEARSYGGYVTPSSVEQQTIAADGSTVVTVRYALVRNSVTFVACGHGEDVTVKSVAFGANLASVAPAMSDAGYDFNGWFRDEDYTVPFDLANSTMPSSDLTLYAKWTARTDATYTVNHYQQNASLDGYTLVATETLTGTTGQKTAAGTKTYEGYAAKEIEQQTVAGDGSTDVNVYYDRRSYTVIYKVDGETYATSNATYGSTLEAPDNEPAKTGCTFAGWAKEGAKAVWDFDADTMPASDLTLSAVWEAKTYKVAFHSGEYGSDPSAQYVEHGSSASEPAVSAVSHHVSGWYANEDLSGEAYDFSSAVTDDLDLYAKWEINTYTVSFDANGGEGAAEAQPVTHGATATEPESSPTKEGSVFKGWFYDAEGSVAVDFAQPVISDATYYAKWADAVTLSFDLNYDGAEAMASQTAEKGAAVGELPRPTRKGYAFDGWYVGETKVGATSTFDANATLTAKWTCSTASYTMNLYEQNETGEGYLAEPTIVLTCKGTTGEQTTTAVPSYEGYKVVTPIEQKTIEADGSTAVNVYYNRNEYKLNFYRQEGDDAPLATMDVRYCAHVATSKLPTATRDEFDFAGWYMLVPSDVEGESPTRRYINWDEDVMDCREIDLYAAWVRTGGVAPYEVKSEFQQVDANGNPTSEYVVDASKTYTLHGNVSDQTTVEPIAYGGYTAQAVTQQTIADEGTVVTVRYDLVCNDVTFSMGGKGEDVTVSDVAYGTSLASRAPAASAAGYVFAGWFRDADHTKPFDLATNVMGETALTLYAKWSPAVDTTYTVNHYQQNAKDDDYTLVATETLTGTTDEAATYTAREYTGFNTPTEVSKTIAGDGSTVVDLKYDRKVYKLWLVSGGVPSSTILEVRYGATATEPASEYSDSYIASWTYQNQSYQTGTFDFSEPLDDAIFAGGDTVFLTPDYAKYSEAYWIAPASSITTSNSSVQQANASYTNPESGIIKNRNDIQADVERIAAGDEATIAEYTEYMESDTYHLYTKVGTGTSTNDYAEFRIIQVGEHDGDGSALTFQATSSVFDSSMNGGENSNAGGWASAALRASMGEGGAIYSKLSTTLTGDIMAVAKKSLSPKATSWVYAEGLSTTFDKLWLPSWSEVYGEGSAATLTYSSRSAFTSQYTYEGAQYAYYKAAGVSSDASNPNNAALVPLMRNRDGSNGEGSLLRTAALEQENWFCQVNSDGRGRADEDATRPAQAGATDSKKIAPCFSFGTKARRTVSFVTNGGSAVGAQQVANGSAVAEATTTRDGCEFVGWYTDAALTQPYVLGTTPVTANTVLYARWTEAEDSVTDSYWLAPAYKYTNGNSDEAMNQVYNADCKQNPQGHVIKDRAQILFDVSKIYAGDEATTVEYTYYSLTDTVHLYTKTRSAGDDNDFNEFRVVQVGEHDSEGNALTFQLSTAWLNQAKMSTNGTNSYKNSDLAKTLNSDSYASEIGTKLWEDIKPATKRSFNTSPITLGFNVVAIKYETEEEPYKVWVASLSEMLGKVTTVGEGYPDQRELFATMGSQFMYFKWHGANTANEENGTTKSLTESRIGYDWKPTAYLPWWKYSQAWTRTPVILRANSSATTEYITALDNRGAFNESKNLDSIDGSKGSTELCYSPCFCF